MPRAQRRCPGDNGNCIELIRNRRYCDEHTIAWEGERTASSRVTSTSEWKRFRAFILDRDHHRCQLRYPSICTGHATVVDKRTPAARRPDLALNPDNAQGACRPCNDHKARTEDKHGKG